MVDDDSPREVPATPHHAETSWLCALYVAVFVIACWVRGVHLFEGLWLDELHTSWTVSAEVGEIEPRAAEGNQSPLYFYAAAVMQGESEWGLRAPSFFAGFLVVFVGMFLGWMVLSPQYAALAMLPGLLIALDSNAIWYSAEARPYALVQLASLVLLLFWVQTVGQPTAFKRAALVVAAVSLFYLHYTTALLLSGLVVDYFRRRWQLGRWPKYSPAMAGLDGTVFVVACLPAAAQLWDIGERRAAWQMFIPKAGVADLAQLPFLIYFAVPGVVALLALWLDRSAVDLLGTDTKWLSCLEDEHREQIEEYLDYRGSANDLALLAAWIVTPLTVAWVLSVTDIARLFTTRYLVGATIVLPLFAVVAMQRAANWIPPWVTCLALLAASLCLGTVPPERAAREPTFLQCWLNGFQVTPRVGEEWREAVAALNASKEGPNWPLFVRSGLIEADRLEKGRSPELVEYCLLPVHGLYRALPEDRPLVPLETTYPGRVRVEDVRLAIERGGAWFLIGGSPADADLTLEDFSVAVAKQSAKTDVVERQDFAGVTLVRVEISRL